MIQHLDNVAYVHDTSALHGWKVYCSVSCVKKAGVNLTSIVPIERADYERLYGLRKTEICDNCSEPLWES